MTEIETRLSNHCANHANRPARTRGLCSMCYQREWRARRQPTKYQVLECKVVTLEDLVESQRVQLETYERVLAGLRRGLVRMSGWIPCDERSIPPVRLEAVSEQRVELSA